MTPPSDAPATGTKWRKAKPIALAADATIDDAMETIATACRDHWQANMAAAIAGEHPEGIHQVRVGFRRFRAFLTLCKTHIPDAQLIWLRAEAKFLGNALGPARDLDVFLTELTEPLARKSAHNADIAALLRAARDARGAAHAEAVKHLTSQRYRRFMGRLNTWIAGRGWCDGKHRNAAPASDFARDVLNRRLVKVKQRTQTLADLTPEKLHRLRISIKKLRYGLEFFRGVMPPRRAARIARTLKGLQDALGYVNDLDVAKRTTARLTGEAQDAKAKAAIARAAGRLTSTFDSGAKTAIPAAEDIAAKLQSQKPL